MAGEILLVTDKTHIFALAPFSQSKKRVPRFVRELGNIL